VYLRPMMSATCPEHKAPMTVQWFKELLGANQRM
jgi:hypothetical protein